jgi:FixJ family two-component response regulator
MIENPTVYLVDDDPGARRSLGWLIRQADFSVCEFESSREFLESLRMHPSACLVLDVRMPEMNGLELQQRLDDLHITLPIIFITAYGDVPSCAKALTSGAVAFLEKPVDHVVLLAEIRKALALSEKQSRRRELIDRLEQLTDTEREVCELLLAGKSLKEIAIARNVAVQTVWKQRVAILKKMGVETDVELATAISRWIR